MYDLFSQSIYPPITTLVKISSYNPAALINPSINYLSLLTITAISHKIPSISPSSTNIVIIPTIACLNVIPSGLFPKAAEIDINKQRKQYLKNSHIVYASQKLLKIEPVTPPTNRMTPVFTAGIAHNAEPISPIVNK